MSGQWGPDNWDQKNNNERETVRLYCWLNMDYHIGLITDKLLHVSILKQWQPTAGPWLFSYTCGGTFVTGKNQWYLATSASLMWDQFTALFSRFSYWDHPVIEIMHVVICFSILIEIMHVMIYFHTHRNYTCYSTMSYDHKTYTCCAAMLRIFFELHHRTASYAPHPAFELRRDTNCAAFKTRQVFRCYEGPVDGSSLWFGQWQVMVDGGHLLVQAMVGQ